MPVAPGGNRLAACRRTVLLRCMDALLSRKRLWRLLIICTAVYVALQVAVIAAGDVTLSRALWLEHENIPELAAAGKPGFSPWRETVQFISNQHFWLLRCVFVFCIAAAVYFRNKDREKSIVYRNISVSTALMLLIVALGITWAIKLGIGKPRPYAGLVAYGPFSPHNKYHSFPSGHMTETFSYIVPLLYFLRKRYLVVPLVLYGVVIALTRVLLAKHYFTDVLFGSYMAAVLGCVLCRTVGVMAERRGRPGRN
jgi:membrane-associated phospholipid phosphatase